MASFYPTRQQLEGYFRTLYPDRAELQNRRAHNVRASLTRLFEEGRGQDIPLTRFTGWAAFNAFTEYVDHHRSTRGSTASQRASQRLQSAWFGSGARSKAQGWKAMMELIN